VVVVVVVMCWTKTHRVQINSQSFENKSPNFTVKFFDWRWKNFKKSKSLTLFSVLSGG
jgi:hypothetical protein